MKPDRSLHFALVASSIFLVIGYILARMYSEDPVQIRVLPLKYPVEGAKATDPPPVESSGLKSDVAPSSQQGPSTVRLKTWNSEDGFTDSW